MGFEPFVHDRLVAVRLRSPEVESSRAILQLVEQRREQLALPSREGPASAGERGLLDKPLLFVLIIGTDCPMPTPDQRRALSTDLGRLRDCCAETRTLVLGRELRQALVRSLVTGFAMLPGRPRPQIDGSVAELLAALEQALGLDPTWLGARLIEGGLISPREASWANESQFVT